MTTQFDFVHPLQIKLMPSNQENTNTELFYRLKLRFFRQKNVYFLKRILYSNNIHIQIITCFCRRQYVVYVLLQGVQEKVCFFKIHCNPSLAYIAVSDLQSSQHNASVQSLLLAGNFLYNHSSRLLARERWQTF